MDKQLILKKKKSESNTCSVMKVGFYHDKDKFNFMNNYKSLPLRNINTKKVAHCAQD